jgi:phage shock protein A
MRTKLAKELGLKSGELARVKKQLDFAVDADDDEVAVVLIGRRDALGEDVDRLASELRELEAEAETAKKNLSTFQTEIARLRDEKTRMLARLANAKARIRFQETLSGLSPDADIRALDAVREHVNRLVEEAKITRDLGDTELERRLVKIRASEADAAARSQLEELKRARRERLVPMLIPEREAVPVARN